MCFSRTAAVVLSNRPLPNIQSQGERCCSEYLRLLKEKEMALYMRCAFVGQCRGARRAVPPAFNHGAFLRDIRLLTDVSSENGTYNQSSMLLSGHFKFLDRPNTMVD
jgi:hypothetical protein